MAKKYEVRQGDLTIELRLERPDFNLLGASNRFLTALFPFLERFGSSAADVTMGNSIVVGDRYVNTMAPRINAGVRLSASKVDVGFNDILRVTFADVQALTIAAMVALGAVEAASRVLLYVVTLNVHGGLEGMTAKEYITAHFSRRPTGLGPDTGGALGFYYGLEGPRLGSSIILDGSALVQDGVYARLAITYDARAIKPDAMALDAKKFLGMMFAALDLHQTNLDL